MKERKGKKEESILSFRYSFYCYFMEDSKWEEIQPKMPARNHFVHNIILVTIIAGQLGCWWDREWRGGRQRKRSETEQRKKSNGVCDSNYFIQTSSSSQ
jgi:hypothetical protein